MFYFVDIGDFVLQQPSRASGVAEGTCTLCDFVMLTSPGRHTHHLDPHRTIDPFQRSLCTTPPLALSLSTRIIDVGQSGVLTAYRTAQHGQALEPYASEPAVDAGGSDGGLAYSCI